MSTTSLARPRQRMASRTIGDTNVIPRQMPDSTTASRKLVGERKPLDDFWTDKSPLCTSWESVVTVVAADILRKAKSMHVSKARDNPKKRNNR